MASRSSRTPPAAVPGPFDCFLVLRGIKTLAVRMDRHCANAATGRRGAGPSTRRSDRVYYPGLAEARGPRTARRQMRGFGGMVSFTVRGGEAQALAVARVHLALHLGRVARGGRVAHRAPASHDPRLSRRVELAIDPALLRLSVGIENIDDLLADLRAALDGACAN